MTMDERQIKDTLRHWIATRSGRVAADAIADDTLILERGIVSSLHVVELIAFVEGMREQGLHVEELRPGAFRSIDTIYAAFFRNGPGVDRHA